MTEHIDLTKNQRVVYTALSDAEIPLTAYEILDLESVRKQGLKAPLTIYRALDKLQDRGLVHRIESLNAFVACSHAPHARPSSFAICDKCRKVVELEIRDCEDHLTSSARSSGFRVDTVHVEMTGRCPECNSA